MEVYYGVDFHPHQQTVCWFDVETGELKKRTIFHKDREELTGFYREMPTGIVGIESTGKADWFEELMFENGHKLLIGNAGLIRKRAETRHKSDSRDAENILALMMRQEFPTLWRRSRESVAILEMIRLRSGLVKQRTQVYNRLQALAHDFGLPKGTMGTKAFQEVLKSIPADPRKAMRRKILLQTVEQLSGSIAEIERKLEEEGAGDSRVALLRTQAGVGNLTALCLIHTLGEVGRFSSAKQVVSFTGLCPLEKSSGSRVRFGPISRTGSPLLRFMLGQAANTAIRRDERLRAFYRRLARKKTKPVAKTAAARKLLVKLSIMLRENITAQEFDLRGSTAGNTRAKQGLK